MRGAEIMERYNYAVLKAGRLMTDKFRYPNEKRETICTATLIQGKRKNILIDPGWHDAAIMNTLKNYRLTPEAIDIVYLSHLHPDHIRSIRMFRNAKWYTFWKEKEIWSDKMAKEDADIFKRTLPLKDQLAADIQIVETPGHTYGHTSVLFENNGAKILIAGDAVLTVDYFKYREVHPNSQNKEMALATLENIDTIANIIIPGHGDLFANFKERG
jgi:glyoxylase-like metal-dependent hydrolase (beta-lactamase superfamily II)